MVNDFTALEAYLSRRLDEVSAEEDIPIYEAWPRVAADMLSYDRNSIEFFPNRDSGIDFFVRSDRTFEIFQCKMHDPDEAGNLALDEPFGADGYKDLQRAVRFLLGDFTPNVDQRLISLREQIREELGLSVIESSTDDREDKVTLRLVLVTLGQNLSRSAIDYSRQLKNELKTLATKYIGLQLELDRLGIEAIGEFFQDPEIELRKPNPIRLRLGYEMLKFDKPSEAEIRTQNFVTFYAPASDLVAAVKKEGVVLFDANVRYELSNSSINEEIRKSASHLKTMKWFHLYNNGVTITSPSWAIKDSGKVVEIREPQIINGCQTIRSLQKVRKDLEDSQDGSPHLLSAFDKSCLVLVRLINSQIVRTEDLVRAANTQNAMEPRNLLGNQTEQRLIEKEMQDFGWFYQRKDGAVDALKEAKKTSLGTSLNQFQVRRERRGRKTIRYCDNRELARRWLSYIGYSYEGKNEKNQHFPPDGKGLYSKVFRQLPRLHKGRVGLDGKSPETAMKEGRPPVIWMLYSYHLFELSKHLLPVASRLRGRVQKEVVAENREPTVANINEKIFGDSSTRLSFALSTLHHVVSELVGYIFSRALGENWLSPIPGKRAIETGSIGEFHEFYEFPTHLHQESILSLKQTDIEKDPALIAIRLAVQAIEATLVRPEILASFYSAQQKRGYLESEQLVREYTRMVDEYDKYLENNFRDWWKSGSPIRAIGRLLMESSVS